MNKSAPIYILAAKRSPIGRLYGALASIRPDDLGLAVLQELPNFSPTDLSAIYVGAANQAGEDNRNLARQLVFLAQWPAHIWGITVNSLCNSGLDACVQAFRALALGEQELVLAGGVENMSRSPFVRLRNQEQEIDSSIGWRMVNPHLPPVYAPLSMPETAERLAQKRGVSRAEQDAYSQASRARFLAAKAAGAFDRELVSVYNRSGELLLDRDEQPRALTASLLAKLPPLVKNGQFISLGNSARLGDGAAFLLLAQGSYLEREGGQPLAQVVGWTSMALPPEDMGEAQIMAVQQLLRQQGLSANEIDFFEFAESFALQGVLAQKALNLRPDQLNPYGGSLSMGNPLGMGGARILVSLAHALASRPKAKYAIGASSAGLGLGTAVLLKKYID